MADALTAVNPRCLCCMSTCKARLARPTTFLCCRDIGRPDAMADSRVAASPEPSLPVPSCISPNETENIRHRTPNAAQDPSACGLRGKSFLS